VSRSLPRWLRLLSSSHLSCCFLLLCLLSSTSRSLRSVAPACYSCDSSPWLSAACRCSAAAAPRPMSSFFVLGSNGGPAVSRAVALSDPHRLLAGWTPRQVWHRIAEAYCAPYYRRLRQRGIRHDDFIAEENTEDVDRALRLLPPHIREGRSRRITARKTAAAAQPGSLSSRPLCSHAAVSSAVLSRCSGT
jgi:hypothetical protein